MTNLHQGALPRGQHPHQEQARSLAVPLSQKEGMTVYDHVDEIKKSLKSLLDAGATQIQEIKDIGGGGLIQ